MKKLSIFYYSIFTTITPPLTIKIHPTQKNDFSETFCYENDQKGHIQYTSIKQQTR